ncbi:MAG TPA: 6-phosphogluconolactonase [Candidatus Dormibacteraeota bacterium]
MSSTALNVRIFDTADEVAAAAADLVAGELTGGARTLSLAGGTTPARAHRLLCTKPIEWGRVTVLFGDERCVPPDDPESNYFSAKQELLDQVFPATVHRMPAELGPETGAALYDPVVRSLAPLDLVLLGMGPDGHTASLFPGSPALQAEGYVVGVRNSPKPPPERVSLTLTALREARRVVFLVTGADKAAAMALVREGSVPSAMIPGAEFLLDRAAAERL